MYGRLSALQNPLLSRKSCVIAGEVAIVNVLLVSVACGRDVIRQIVVGALCNWSDMGNSLY